MINPGSKPGSVGIGARGERLRVWLVQRVPLLPAPQGHLWALGKEAADRLVAHVLDKFG